MVWWVLDVVVGTLIGNRLLPTLDTRGEHTLEYFFMIIFNGDYLFARVNPVLRDEKKSI